VPPALQVGAVEHSLQSAELDLPTPTCTGGIESGFEQFTNHRAEALAVLPSLFPKGFVLDLFQEYLRPVHRRNLHPITSTHCIIRSGLQADCRPAYFGVINEAVIHEETALDL
jgi:hypothetical protein